MYFQLFWANLAVNIFHCTLFCIAKINIMEYSGKKFSDSKFCSSLLFFDFPNSLLKRIGNLPKTMES